MDYIRIKQDGASVRGYILTTVVEKDGKFVSDFKTFKQHGDWDRNIHSHGCADPNTGKACLSCQQKIASSNITIVPIYDVDAKCVRVFEAKKKHMKAIYGFIDLYGEDAPTTAIYLTRNGVGTATTYSVTPTPPNVLKKEAAVWTLPADVKDALTDDFYLGIIAPPGEDYLRKLLGIDAVEDADIVAISDDDLPF